MKAVGKPPPKKRNTWFNFTNSFQLIWRWFRLVPLNLKRDIFLTFKIYYGSCLLSPICV